VANQGLYELTAGSRLADAIAAAGGESDGADVHRLNLATPLVDGMHIRVPLQGADPRDPELPLIELPTATGSGAGGGPVLDGAVAASPTRIDVNRAGVDELERLPGVGPAIAAAIVAWREDNGPFRTVDDLLAVPGIGPAKLSAMEDQVGL
jgi:competence protein ComEA